METYFIRYQWVRDPAKGDAFAILMGRTFAVPALGARQSWRMRLSTSGVQALSEFPPQAMKLPREAFAADPRIGALRWERGGR